MRVLVKVQCNAMQCNVLQNYDSINDPCHVTLTSAEEVFGFFKICFFESHAA